MKSDMESVISHYSSSTTVHVASAQCETSSGAASTGKELCNYYNLPYYPYLVYGTDGTKKGEYSGSRTASAMQSFIDSKATTVQTNVEGAKHCPVGAVQV